jgi:hypothetical protein
MPKPTKSHLSRHDLLRVAARAGCDPRAVARYFTGEPMRSTTHRRVEDALLALGFAAGDPSLAPIRSSSRH